MEIKSQGNNLPIHVMIRLIEMVGFLLEKMVVAMKKPRHSETPHIKVVKIHPRNRSIVQIYPMTKREIFMDETLVHH